MEAVKILERPQNIDWDYDEDADVLYLSVGIPRKAIGIDIGEGLIIRYDEKNREIVGMTIIGLKEKILKQIK
jgi:uncharacterized protein YuzE